MCVCMRVYVRVTKGRLKACVCLHVSVCICVYKFICVSMYAHAHNNGGLKVEYKPSYKHTCINASIIGTHRL